MISRNFGPRGGAVLVRMLAPVLVPAIGALGALGFAPAAHAQRTQDNAVTSAEDAFGTTVGRETIGIYDESNVRGFNPGSAGNFRMEGMYVDIEGGLSGRVLNGETIRIGTSAQGYTLPAPTGIVDLSLKEIGAKPVVSPVISGDSFGSYGMDIDLALPLDGARLGLATGFGWGHDGFANGGHSFHHNVGAVTRWKPAQGVELTAFGNAQANNDETAQALYAPTGAFLPVGVRRGHHPGALYGANSHTEMAGLIGKVRAGEWTVRAGLFRSQFHQDIGINNIVQVRPDMSTTRQLYLSPGSPFASWSGELRVSRRLSEGPRRHLLTLALRGRAVDGHYGDSEETDLGSGGINDLINPPRPATHFASTALTDDRTRQATLGLSYGLNWRGLGELTLGLQRTHYVKRVNAGHQAEWVWLPSLSAAAPLAKGLTLYGSYVRGIEDSGAAPGYAANANQVLPAIRTWQYDFGARWSPAKGTTLIAGWFAINKPYITLGSDNYYRVLGSEKHQGIETSLTYDVTRDLRVVAGGVIQSPRVTASPLIASPIGAIPVGQPKARTRFSANWTLPFAKAFTLDAYVNHDSSSAGTVENTVFAPGSTRVGGGVRYSFKIAGKPVTARVSLFNIGNAFEWVPVGSGVYAYNTPRNVTAYLAADF